MSWEDGYEARKAERDAFIEELKRTTRYSRNLNESMRMLGAPPNWRDLPPAPAAPVAPPTDAERQAADDYDDGFIFSAREERLEAARLAHESRRRRAAQETEQRERLFATYRRLYGLDEANRLLGR